MDGYPSVSSHSHSQHLTAATASRPDCDPGKSQAQCGVTVSYQCLGSVSPPYDTRTLEPSFRRRRGQMTCMPLVSSEGGRLFKKGSFELGQQCVCVCVFMWKVAAVSHAIKERPPPDNHTGIHSSLRSNTGVLWHLQTGDRTYSGLPVVSINPFPFSTTAQALEDITYTHMHIKENATLFNNSNAIFMG